MVAKTCQWPAAPFVYVKRTREARCETQYMVYNDSKTSEEGRKKRLVRVTPPPFPDTTAWRDKPLRSRKELSRVIVSCNPLHDPP